MALAATLPFLARMICPSLQTALALRVASLDLRCALGEGALCTMALADRRLVSQGTIEMCVEKMSNADVLADAVCWGKLVAPALLATLESFSTYICPSVRYFCENTEQLLQQIRVTLRLLAELSCEEMVCKSHILRRMGACNEEVDRCLRALQLDGRDRG